MGEMTCTMCGGVVVNWKCVRCGFLFSVAGKEMPLTQYQKAMLLMQGAQMMLLNQIASHNSNSWGEDRSSRIVEIAGEAIMRECGPEIIALLKISKATPE